MIHFYKMQALGNDFIVLVEASLFAEHVRFLSNRHYGIGADQVICLHISSKNKSTRVSFFNADGTQAEMCGNGLRCVGLLLTHLTGRKSHTVHTCTRAHILDVLNAGMVRVSMGTVEILSSMSAEHLLAQESTQDFKPFVQDYGLVNVGNPHLVFFVRNPDTAMMAARFGPIFEKHPLFPKRINVGFAYYPVGQKHTLPDPLRFSLSVWERGAGLTYACGSGALAAAALGRHLYAWPVPCEVNQQGGSLIINVNGTEYTQTGHAQLVFEADISLPLDFRVSHY
ncbi:MAG: diaminopimelate epimerase [Holosporales bacterium]|jgi:diaminopimelate epimerase|nr:diaminopimelate epimerase [Holosporales bacterium]